MGLDSCSDVTPKTGQSNQEGLASVSKPALALMSPCKCLTEGAITELL